MAANREHFGSTALSAESIAARLTKAKRTGSGWVACCPAHDDGTPSLSISDGERGPVFKCHAGCTQDAVIGALEALGVQIRKPRPEADVLHPLLNLESLSVAKGLSMETLNANHVIEGQSRGVGFQYLSIDGSAVIRTKYRKYLGGGADRGFAWGPGSAICLYGLWRLEKDFANDGRIILCEGETDALTLWQHGYTALALPGASMWREEWIRCIPEGAKVYVVIEPDQGGRTVEAAIEKSALKDRAWFIRMPEATKDPNQLHLNSEAGFVDDFEALISRAEPAITISPPRIVLRHLADILADKTETEWLIDDTLEHKVMALMVGARGSLKSFVALDWLMRLAVEGKPVVALSAEGSGLNRRIDAWHRTFASAVDPRAMPLVAMERSISLCVEDVREELVQAIRGTQDPCVVLVDTLSKYSAGLDENENSDVRDFIEALSDSLRHTFGCTILMVAHTGHIASDRIRGASTFGANTEAEYIVTRPSPLEFVCKVSRERFKDAPPLDPLGYQGEVVDLGRLDKRGKPVTSLVMRSGIELPPPKVKAAGSNQLAAMVALREWAAAHPADVIAHDELAALLKRQGISAKRKPEILNWLVNAGALLPSVGGHRVIKEAIK